MTSLNCLIGEDDLKQLTNIQSHKVKNRTANTNRHSMKLNYSAHPKWEYHQKNTKSPGSIISGFSLYQRETFFWIKNQEVLKGTKKKKSSSLSIYKLYFLPFCFRTSHLNMDTKQGGRNLIPQHLNSGF